MSNFCSSNLPLGGFAINTKLYPVFLPDQQRAPTSLDNYTAGTRWQDNSQDPPVIYQTTGDGVWEATTNAPEGLTDHALVIGQGAGVAGTIAVLANGQLAIGSTGADPVPATLTSTLGTIVNTTGAGSIAQDVNENLVRYASVAVSSSEILNLTTAPKTLVAAPASGKFLEFISASLILDYNSSAYTESGDDMVIRYTNGSGVVVSQDIVAASFITATADTITNALPAADAVVAASGAVAQALVLHNTGSNYAAGNSTMTVQIAYRVHTSGL